jgi:hypothetical protein
VPLADASDEVTRRASLRALRPQRSDGVAESDSLPVAAATLSRSSSSPGGAALALLALAIVAVATLAWLLLR